MILLTCALFSIFSSPHHEHPGFEQYSDAELYTQLRYFAYLFDGEKAIDSAVGPVKGLWACLLQEFIKLRLAFRLTDLVAAVVRAPANAALLRSLAACVDKYLDQCGRRWVDLSAIFGKMKVKTAA